VRLGRETFKDEEETAGTNKHELDCSLAFVARCSFLGFPKH